MTPLMLNNVILISFAVTDPKELATGLEKREILNEEAGKDPVCDLFHRTVFSCHISTSLYTLSDKCFYCRTHMV
jgi:hypothetical protein